MVLVSEVLSGIVLGLVAVSDRSGILKEGLLSICLVLTKGMNFFPLEILNVCMFLYVDLHDLGSHLK